MAFQSREKKPFSNCIQGIRQDYLRRPVCHDVYGDPALQPEMDWIIPKCAARDTIQTRQFCNSLGLTKDEASAVIHAAPRSKEQQLRQAVFVWSKNNEEATLEKLLEALYIRDEVELVESICQSLLPLNISDERKIDPQPQEVYVSDQIKVQAVPHKVVQEEEVVSPSSLGPEESGGPFFKPVRVSSAEHIKPQLPRQSSDQDVVRPVSATERGQYHAVMAWPKQQVIPGHLFQSSDKELHIPSKNRTGSSAIQVQDGALDNSLTFQGETSSPNMLLEARMTRLEKEMKEMREESRKEDAKLRDQIEELKRELQKKDTEIFQLKMELQIEAEQKQEAERQLDLERKQAEASSEELQRKLEELKKELQERDAQIETLRRKKGVSTYSSVEENDGCDDREYVHSNSEEDRAVVTNWKFEETKLLGCGNFGIVFKGLCQDTGRELAVKIVRDLNDKTIKSLEQEYNMLSTLRHRRIVSYLGVCYQPHPTHGEECLFIMTEFMPGGSLADFYKEKGPLNEILTRRYTRQILQGVEYLHQQDIIHRDIKGSNIMRNTRGHVKLADFGSAKKIFSETSEKSKTSYLYGTAPWAAPEVLRSEPAQSQSDIWSVAATVVEMMTAERPYKSEPNIKDNSAIVYLVGTNKLNPLQSVSVKKLIGNEKMTENAVDFLKECFKRVADERPAASDLLRSFNFCQKESNA